MVISTNAPRALADKEVEVINRQVSNRIIGVYSAVSDSGMLKKDPAFYKEVYEDLMQRGFSRVVHLGDDYLNDYIAPLRAGLGAYYLERNKINLYDLMKIVRIL